MSRRVLIVGAGAVGCLSAIRLAERGWQVDLVDRTELGAESSWAGGGILFPLLPWNYGEAVNRLALAGASAYPALCRNLLAETGIDPEYLVSGMLIGPCSVSRAALDWCAARAVACKQQRDHLWLPGIAQVRNPRLMRALRARLPALGVTLHEHTEMMPLADAAGCIAQWCSSDGQCFRADRYVVTAGAWSSRLLGPRALTGRFRPMRGQMLLYRLASDALPHIRYQDGFYLIPRGDGHILAGSTVEDAGFDKSTTTAAAEALQRKAVSMMPALAAAPVIKHWSGLRPGSPDNVPVIDRHPAFDNLYLNTGHFRYGVTMAPASADILAALLCGDALPAGARDFAFPR